MNANTARSKKYFWYFAIPLIPLLVITILFIANSQPTADKLDSKFVQINSFIEKLAAAYVILMPENLAAGIADFLSSSRNNQILISLLRGFTLLNFLVAAYITFKSIYDTAAVLITLKRKQSATIRIFFPFALFLKNQSKEKQ